jgi:hypothetical protein
MKKFIKLVSLVSAIGFFAVACSAVNATFLASFDQDNGVDDSLEYVIEELQNGTWVEVAVGPTSPISYTRSVPYGSYQVRVYVRIKRSDWARDIENDTSPATSTQLRPGKPSNPKITSNKSVALFQDFKANPHSRLAVTYSR